MIVVPYSSYGYTKNIQRKPQSFAMPVHLKRDANKRIFFHIIRSIKDIHSFYTYKMYKQWTPYFNRRGFCVCIPYEVDFPSDTNQTYPIKVDHAYWWNKGKVLFFPLKYSDIWKTKTSQQVLKELKKI